jgi:hypothetical protein
MTQQQAEKVAEIVECVGPILAGNPPEVIGAALADLFATLLAGHYDPRGPEETAKMREELISRWLDIARQLIEVNEKIILARYQRGSH